MSVVFPSAEIKKKAAVPPATGPIQAMSVGKPNRSGTTEQSPGTAVASRDGLAARGHGPGTAHHHPDADHSRDPSCICTRRIGPGPRPSRVSRFSPALDRSSRSAAKRRRPARSRPSSPRSAGRGRFRFAPVHRAERRCWQLATLCLSRKPFRGERGASALKVYQFFGLARIGGKCSSVQTPSEGIVAWRGPPLSRSRTPWRRWPDAGWATDRRTDRLVDSARRISQHPGGTLPEKLNDPAAYRATLPPDEPTRRDPRRRPASPTSSPPWSACAAPPARS